MVKVKMLKLAAGPQGIVQIGQEIELTKEAAVLYVEGGYAVYVDKQADTGPATIETATTKTPERAVSQRGKRGKNA